MVDIYNHVPEEGYGGFLNELCSKLDSLFYTAPELLSNYIIDIHLMLEKNIPLHENATDNPLWVNAINTIWQKALEDYKTFDHSKKYIRTPSIEEDDEKI